MACIWNLSGIPYLNESQYVDFKITPECEDIIAVGGNLSPGLLLSAYKQGIFPWYNEGEEILWWSLKERFVLFPEELHWSKSLLKKMRQSLFFQQGQKSMTTIWLTLDHAFSNVVKACAKTLRSGQRKPSTWITSAMEYAYNQLYQLGYAHSVECWTRQPDGNPQLVGGLYGVSLGKCFYGESMFSHVPDTSKIAFVVLILFLHEKGFKLIDCQQKTAHLERFGARSIEREKFEYLLRSLIPVQPNSSLQNRLQWEKYQKEFPNCTALEKLLS